MDMLLGVMAFVGAVFYCLFGTSGHSLPADCYAERRCSVGAIGRWSRPRTRHNRSVWSANILGPTQPRKRRVNASSGSVWLV
jgi:hypothetical protein